MFVSRSGGSKCCHRPRRKGSNADTGGAEDGQGQTSGTQAGDGNGVVCGEVEPVGLIAAGSVGLGVWAAGGSRASELRPASSWRRLLHPGHRVRPH